MNRPIPLDRMLQLACYLAVFAGTAWHRFLFGGSREERFFVYGAVGLGFVWARVNDRVKKRLADERSTDHPGDGDD